MTMDQFHIISEINSIFLLITTNFSHHCAFKTSADGVPLEYCNGGDAEQRLE